MLAQPGSGDGEDFGLLGAGGGGSCRERRARGDFDRDEEFAGAVDGFNCFIRRANHNDS